MDRVDCLQGGPGLVELALKAETHGGSSQVGPWWVDLAPTFSRKSLPPFVVDTWLQFNVHNNNINQVLISGWRQFWSLLWAPVSSKIVVAVQCPLQCIYARTHREIACSAISWCSIHFGGGVLLRSEVGDEGKKVGKGTRRGECGSAQPI